MLQEGRALCRGWAVSTYLVLPRWMSSGSLEPTAVSRLYPNEWHTGEEYSVPPSVPCLLQPCSFCHHPSLLSSWLLRWGKSPIPVVSSPSSPFYLSLIPSPPFFLSPPCLLSLSSLFPSPPLLLSPLLLRSHELIRGWATFILRFTKPLQTNSVKATSSI